MTIRPYEERDKEAVRYACLNSDGPCDMDAAGVSFLLATYCDYYTEVEPQNCFVAVNEKDEAVGYVICAESFNAFRPVFFREYLTRIDPANARYREWAAHSVDLHERFQDDYPAHLHIDLLPAYQRRGLGTALIDTLRAHLRQKGIPGVMLTVGDKNETGIRFYEKYGFTRLAAAPGDIAYGIAT